MEENCTGAAADGTPEARERSVDRDHLVELGDRLLQEQRALRRDLRQELDKLRDDYAGDLAYRTLKDLCRELATPLAAMEKLVDDADLSDTVALRAHVESLVITLRSVLGRMGAEKIAIDVGQETFDPDRHLCVRVVPAESSPFPSAPARTVVGIVEDGYTLADRILAPASVEVQGNGSTRRSD